MVKKCETVHVAHMKNSWKRALLENNAGTICKSSVFNVLSSTECSVSNVECVYTSLIQKFHVIKIKNKLEVLIYEIESFRERKDILARMMKSRD